MLRYGMAFQEPGASAYQKAPQERHVRGLERRAKALGYQLVPTG
jgi:transposase